MAEKTPLEMATEMLQGCIFALTAAYDTSPASRTSAYANTLRDAREMVAALSAAPETQGGAPREIQIAGLEVAVRTARAAALEEAVKLVEELPIELTEGDPDHEIPLRDVIAWMKTVRVEAARKLRALSQRSPGGGNAT